VCGRFTLSADPEALRDEFGPLDLPEGLGPRYNIAPTQPVAVITNREPTRARLHHFGLVPHWAKDRSVSHRMINARRETLAQKPAFRDPFRARRCLVLADGFYEWQRVDGGKQPHLVRLRSRRPFGFAGLWALWTGSDGVALPSCTIITAPAAGCVTEVHHRMPVIVPRAQRSAWLHPNPQDPAVLDPLLDATPVSELELLPVGTHVNSPAHEGPECIAPAGPARSC
jgi:putative SOS response-associated peptidase YedK